MGTIESLDTRKRTTGTTRPTTTTWPAPTARAVWVVRGGSDENGASRGSGKAPSTAKTMATTVPTRTDRATTTTPIGVRITERRGSNEGVGMQTGRRGIAVWGGAREIGVIWGGWKGPDGLGKEIASTADNTSFGFGRRHAPGCHIGFEGVKGAGSTTTRPTATPIRAIHHHQSSRVEGGAAIGVMSSAANGTERIPYGSP